jgi:protease secretion system membrane fusion protein
MENKTADAGSLLAAMGKKGAAQADTALETGRAARLGLWVLGLGFGGFLLWAALAPLDEGVPSAGMVAIDTKRKAVQHLSGGIVTEVLVREGEVVKEEQVLFRLDRAVARANYESVRQRYLGLRAMQGRLLAEQAGVTGIVFHPDLQQAASDPLIRSQMVTQQQLLQSRLGALRADLQAIEESVQGQEALIRSSESVRESRRQQLRLLTEELKNTREMVNEGYAPRNRQLELERAVAETDAALAEVAGSIARAHRSIAELRQRAMARQQQHRKELETELASVTLEVQSDAERYVAAKADLVRTEVKSPAAGQVVGLTVQTVGGIIQAGQKLMDIVPAEAPLLLEARVEPHLIDRIRAGLNADIRFSAFSHSPQLVVEGKVLSVSSDLLTDQQTGVSYYLARVEVTESGRKVLAGRHLQPGMPAELVIKTGERSMLTYLLSPLTKRLAASLKEE